MTHEQMIEEAEALYAGWDLPVRPNPLSPGELAKKWRREPDMRQTVERIIFRLQWWDRFHFCDLYRDGGRMLVAIDTDEDKIARLGADVGNSIRLAGGERYSL